MQLTETRESKGGQFRMNLAGKTTLDRTLFFEGEYWLKKIDDHHTLANSIVTE